MADGVDVPYFCPGSLLYEKRRFQDTRWHPYARALVGGHPAQYVAPGHIG